MESVAPNPVELTETVEASILVIRGQKVLIDADLAQLYGVPTKRFNEQVRRNRERFPADFMFQLTVKEKSEVVANCVHLSKLKYSPYQPFAFTEHGAIMAATILNSPKATEMSVFIVRAFVRLRGMLSAHHELADKLDELENKVATHDQAITGLLNTIRQLTSPPVQPKRLSVLPQILKNGNYSGGGCMPLHQPLPPGRGKVRMGVERWKCRNIPIVSPLYPHPSLPPARGKEQNTALLSSYEK